ncbi:TRM11 family SAM-dependent methyltransferase [Stygiolobus caldivivus]|uniref:tRNA (guanine(10)-N(2))-dimethyltransferase n=1 Tax=Stygiolobus caldivivus TaxID=2824673 RepID=A0A8D5U660_9CREN|nr:DNA methyltransferase [Stygiolobus caldivivus]BCU70241.1 RNA methyltransferase [Stygiolobus caldivivus]
MNYAYLNLDNIFLALHELRSLIHGTEKEYYYGVALYDGSEKVAEKSGTIKKSGVVLAMSTDVKDIVDQLRGHCFSVDIDVPMREYKNYAKGVYGEVVSSIKTSKKCDKLDLIVTEGMIIAGKRASEKDTWSLISHSKRPYTQSGSLNPELGRVMVNLSESSQQILDPFVGTGTIMIEGKWLGLNCIGSDIDPSMVYKTLFNLKHFNYDCEILQADATFPPMRETESVVTDPPYGRSFSPKGLSDLYEEFFYSVVELVRGKVVFTTDFKFDWRDALKSSGFKDIQIHTIYEHKSLSRAIYVVTK